MSSSESDDAISADRPSSPVDEANYGSYEASTDESVQSQSDSVVSSNCGSVQTRLNKSHDSSSHSDVAALDESHDSRSDSDSQPDVDSPPTSPDLKRRRRYGLYKDDASVPVPRETQRRWLLTGQIASLNSGNPLPLTETTANTPHLQTCDTGSCISANNCSSESEAVGSSALSSDEHYSREDSIGDINRVHSSGSEVDQDLNSSCDSDSDSFVAADDNDGSSSLYPGCDKSTDEAILDICHLFLKHRWTKASLNDNLKLFASTLPKGNNIPSSLYQLYKHVNASSAPCVEKSYYYCSSCRKLKEGESEVCVQCNINTSGVFYYMSISDQLCYMFESSNLADAIDEYRREHGVTIGQETTVMSDIVDGSEYKRVRQYANGPYDIILMWNTDGVSSSKSSHVELYPVFSSVCEVNPKKRSVFTMVNCLWVDSFSPKMNEFLKPYVQEIKKINECGGVEWIHPKTGAGHKSRVSAPHFVGDAPMRADVLGLQRHNAMYACFKCEQKTAKLPRRENDKRSLRRFVFIEDSAPQRTSERMSIQGSYAEERGLKHVKGVKGRAVIEEIPHLNRASCTVAEYMHSVLLGVTFYFTYKWFFKPGPWYIKSCIKLVDDFLLSIKVPDFMRGVRKVSDINHFKASELRAWLLFISLVVLQRTKMPDRYYQHWILLVKSVFILLQDEISDDDLSLAEVMLKCFVRDIGKLYTDHDYVYNVHQLIHLTTYVREWGPLFTNSTFLYENYNGILSRMVHGTKHQAKELVESLKLAHCIQVLRVNVKNASEDVNLNDKIKLSGSVILSDDELDVLKNKEIFSYRAYSRLCFKTAVYTSQCYDKNKKKCNSINEFNIIIFSILLKDGKKLCGQIVSFIKTSDSVYCLLNTYKVRHVDVIFHRESLQRISHLSPVEVSNNRVLVELSAIQCKVLKVGNFIATEPNRLEKKIVNNSRYL